MFAWGWSFFGWVELDKRDVAMDFAMTWALLPRLSRSCVNCLAGPAPRLEFECGGLDRDLVNANHVLRHARTCSGHPRLDGISKNKGVDGRDKPGHDGACDSIRRRVPPVF